MAPRATFSLQTGGWAPLPSNLINSTPGFSNTWEHWLHIKIKPNAMITAIQTLRVLAELQCFQALRHHHYFYIKINVAAMSIQLIFAGTESKRMQKAEINLYHHFHT